MSLFLSKSLSNYPNEHRDLIQTHFRNASADLTTIPIRTRFLFIGFTNRCGSHFLGEALASSGVLNDPGETFHADMVISTSKAHDLHNLGQYVGHLARTLARNDILVSKVSVTQLAMLVQAGILDHIVERSSFLLLERDDKLGQAISYALALATGQWTSAQKAHVKPEQVSFSPDVVCNFMRGVAHEMDLFRSFFQDNGIDPLNIKYEILEAMPEKVVAEISQWLDLPDLHFVKSALRLRRQRSEVTESWRRRFQEAHKNALGPTG